MNFTKTRTLHNVKLVDGKLVFDKEFFRVGRELVTNLYITRPDPHDLYSTPRMCTVVSCTDTLLTIMLAGDSECTELTIDQYIKKTVFWVLYKKADTKESILNELIHRESSCRRLLESDTLCGFAVLGEKYKIKSDIMAKFTSYLTEKLFMLIDNNDDSYIFNGIADDGLSIGVIAMKYSESPEDYIVGDFEEITVFDRTRNVSVDDFMSKFKKLAVFNAKTMTIEEDDLSKCITTCEGYDHELMKKIPVKTIIAFKSDSSIYTCINVSTLMHDCPHKTLVTKIDYVRAAECTNVSVTYDDIFNSID